MADSENVFLIAPLHIKRKEDIAEVFSVSPETVSGWAKEGAPIFLVGNKYQVDYHSLVNWLTKNKSVSKRFKTPPLPPL